MRCSSFTFSLSLSLSLSLSRSSLHCLSVLLFPHLTHTQRKRERKEEARSSKSTHANFEALFFFFFFSLNPSFYKSKLFLLLLLLHLYIYLTSEERNIVWIEASVWLCSIKRMHRSQRFVRVPAPIEESPAFWWKRRFRSSARCCHFMELKKVRCSSRALFSRFCRKLRFDIVVFEVSSLSLSAISFFL